MPKRRERLEFFPGEKRLILVVDGTPALEIEAWGGPQTEVSRGPGEPFGAGPTDPGQYVIWTVAPYVTRTWPWSRIRWGARLKLATDDLDDLLYQADAGKWRSVKKLTGLKRATIAHRYYELYGEWRVPETWVFNDFGPTAIRYFKDRNHDGRLDDGETLSGEMFHTTPDNEASSSASMYESHGCIHLRPAQRDRMIGAGGFRRGMPLVIHTYTERFTP